MEAPRPRILLVDDDGEWIELIEEILRNEGYSVAVASDGLLALEQVARFDPFIVVTDLHMPIMDGRQLLAQLLVRNAKIPVIVVTGDPVNMSSAGLTGAFRVITKPSTLAGLISAVADAVAHRVSHLPLQRIWAAAGRSRRKRRSFSPAYAVRRIKSSVSSIWARIEPIHVFIAAATMVSSIALLIRWRLTEK